MHLGENLGERRKRERITPKNSQNAQNVGFFFFLGAI